MMGTSARFTRPGAGARIGGMRGLLSDRVPHAEQSLRSRGLVARKPALYVVVLALTPAGGNPHSSFEGGCYQSSKWRLVKVCLTRCTVLHGRKEHCVTHLSVIRPLENFSEASQENAFSLDDIAASPGNHFYLDQKPACTSLRALPAAEPRAKWSTR